MSPPNAAEVTLLAAVTDVDQLEQFANTGLDLTIIPTPGVAPILEWAVKYFLDTRRKQAPSRVALITTWGSALEEMDVELEDEDLENNSVQWACETLRGAYASRMFQDALHDGARAMATADHPQRASVVNGHAVRMAALAEQVRDRPSAIDAATGFIASVDRAEDRRDNPGVRQGLGLGLPLVDKHTGGIQAGELGIAIAPDKAGKSFLGLNATLKHFEYGFAPALFTLENTIPATFDRMACVALRIDYKLYQRGQITAAELERLRGWHSQHAKDLAERMTVLRPGPGGRTAEAICTAARLRGADAIIIDQLSHLEMAGRGRFSSDREGLAAKIQELGAAASSEPEPLKVLLLAQASRDAKKSADKTGHLDPHAGGGTSEIERAADLLFGLYVSEEDKRCGEATLDLLRSRRTDTAGWGLAWRPWVGDIRVLNLLPANG